MSFDSLFQFEDELAEYTGAPFVVLTDGCTHAIELVMRLMGVRRVESTAYTYLSVIMTLRDLGIEYTLTDEQWTGEYRFHGTNIWDSARRLEPGMYRPGQIQCLSFGYSKPLDIGKCGAILLDDKSAHDRLSLMRSDGRDLSIMPWQSQSVFKQGWHYCPTIETIEKGRARLPLIKPQCQTATYPDCREILFDA